MTRYSIKDISTGGRLVLKDWVKITNGSYEGQRGQIKSFPTAQSANIYIPEIKKTVKISNRLIEFARAG